MPAPSTSALANAGLLKYIEFPTDLHGKYQSFTQADLTALRGTGCQHQFADVATGVARYVRWLTAQAGSN